MLLFNHPDGNVNIKSKDDVYFRCHFIIIKNYLADKEKEANINYYVTLPYNSYILEFVFNKLYQIHNGEEKNYDMEIRDKLLLNNDDLLNIFLLIKELKIDSHIFMNFKKQIFDNLISNLYNSWVKFINDN